MLFGDGSWVDKFRWILNVNKESALGIWRVFFVPILSRELVLVFSPSSLSQSNPLACWKFPIHRWFFPIWLRLKISCLDQRLRPPGDPYPRSIPKRRWSRLIRTVWINVERSCILFYHFLSHSHIIDDFHYRCSIYRGFPLHSVAIFDYWRVSPLWTSPGSPGPRPIRTSTSQKCSRLPSLPPPGQTEPFREDQGWARLSHINIRKYYTILYYTLLYYTILYYAVLC